MIDFAALIFIGFLAAVFGSGFWLGAKFGTLARAIDAYLAFMNSVFGQKKK